MSNFKKYLLGDIAEIQTGPFGSQLHEEDYVSIGTPIVTVEHLGETGFIQKNLPFVSDEDKKRLSKYLLKEGDIVFSRVGSIDRCTYVSLNEDGWLFSGRCLRVRINEKANAKYISYYFRQRHFKAMMLNISVGATMPSLNTSLMANISLTLPPIDTQNKIDSVLSALDAKIELNNRINAELEAMAKTLYDYWFVQFDFPAELSSNFSPSKGKMSEGQRGYKTSGGKMVWNEQLKREIPEGWEVKKLSDWIESTKSGDWGSDCEIDNYTKKVICFRGADINGLNGVSELNPPTRFILEKNESKILSSHDLIIEISGGSPTQSTGRLAYITDATINRFAEPMICSNFCKAISLKDHKYLYNFAYLWNTLYDNGAFFGYEGKTSGIKNLLFDSFVNSYWTAFPDQKLIENFYSFMETIQQKKQKALSENQHLTSLRDWLLPMLMNGQVTVGGKEKVVYKTEDSDIHREKMAAEPGGEEIIH